MSKSNKKNLIIGGLLAIVLIMAVGYAAFATNLNITGSSAITSNWDVHIKDNGVNAKNPTQGAASTKARKVDALTGEFACTLRVPGTSSIEYDIEVENSGSFDASLDTVTISGTTEAVSAVVTESSSLKQGDTITKNGGTDTLTIKVSLNDISSLPSVTTIDITVKLDFSQATGGSGGAVASGFDATTGNGTIYRWSTEIWYNEGTTASGETATDISSKTLGTDYVTDPSTLNKNYYLKHTVANNIITKSYVCFVYDSVERCLKGFDTSAFADNTSIVQDYQTAAGLNTVSSPSSSNPGCKFSSSDSSCSGGGFYRVYARSYGDVGVSGSSSEYCIVYDYGISTCSQ